MNLLDLSEIRRHLGTIQRCNDENSKQIFFNRIKFNGFEINFYAGPKAFCEPPSLLDSLLDYKKIQIGIDEHMKGFDGGAEHTISPMIDERFHNFNWAQYFFYSDSNGVIKSSYMGNQIPLNDVCQLVKDVYKISRLKIFY
jgi:hypothetical protein